MRLLYREYQRKEVIKIFTLIFISAFVLYLVILFTSQSHVDGDEGVVGIMSWHILSRNSRPIFFYGQVYGGGAALEAYLAVIPFTLFGISSISLKLVAFTISLLTLGMTFWFCLRYINTNTAILATGLLAISTPLIEWHTKMRGGYAEMLLLSILIMFLYCHIVYRHKTHSLNFLLLGVLSGLAYYNSAMILSQLLGLLIVSIYWRKTIFRWSAVMMFILGFYMGTAPLIQYELTHDFPNTRFVFSLRNSATEPIFSRIIALFGTYLPSFYVGRNVDGYISQVPLTAWIEYIITFGLLGYSVYAYRNSWRKILAPWNTQTHGQQYPPKPESLLVISVGFHLVVCAVSQNTALSPRYFLPIYPAVAIITASVLHTLLNDRTKVKTLVAVFILGTLIVLGITTYFQYIRPSTVTDDVLLTDGRIVNVQTTGTAAVDLAQFLQENGISTVRSGYFIQWRLIFESREKIIASSNGFVPGLSRFTEYDIRVDESQKIAYIFHKDSAQLQDFTRTDAAGHFRKNQIHEYVVFYP